MNRSLLFLACAALALAACSGNSSVPLTRPVFAADGKSLDKSTAAKIIESQGYKEVAVGAGDGENPLAVEAGLAEAQEREIENGIPPGR